MRGMTFSAQVEAAWCKVWRIISFMLHKTALVPKVGSLSLMGTSFLIVKVYFLNCSKVTNMTMFQLPRRMKDGINLHTQVAEKYI